MNLNLPQTVGPPGGTSLAARSASRRADPTQPTGTAQAILDAAIVELETSGVAGFRIERVLAEANSSKGSFRHHFGNREGLVQAAEYERYLMLATSEQSEILDLMDALDTNDAFCSFMAAQLVRIATSDAVAKIRQARVTVFANALGRPQLMDSITWLLDIFISTQAEAVGRAQARGIVNSELDVYDYLAFFHGLTLGRTFTEGIVDDPERWLAIAIPAALAPLRMP
jgi:AcrR family transcriptional regulator